MLKNKLAFFETTMLQNPQHSPHIVDLIFLLNLQKINKNQIEANRTLNLFFQLNFILIAKIAL
jgi:hypothetical protein